MRTTGKSVFALAALCAAADAFGQQITREGTEFQINTNTVNRQDYASAAADADGDFVVVWQAAPVSYTRIFGKRYASTGVALAAEFQVNTYTEGNHRYADVAMDAEGDFSVVWVDENLSGLLLRRFSSAGAPLSGDNKVAQAEGQSTQPAVDAEADGDFVIAWVDYVSDGEGSAIVARRFSSAGTALATEFLVNVYTLSDQRHPDVSLDSDGDFVVVWDSAGAHDGYGYGVFGRLFSSSGVAQGTEILINAYTAQQQSLPVVSMDPGGKFVVGWNSYDQDGDNYGVFARGFSSSGAPLTGDLQVNAHTVGDQRLPAVSTNGAGAFVVSWMSYVQDGASWGVFARRFSSSGVALASELQVNTYTTAAQRAPDVTAGNSGTFVVAWHSFEQDGSSYGVFGQRFSAKIVLDVDGDGTVLPLTDLILGLRYAFGFRGNTLINGAVGIGCSRCDAPSIEAYIAGLVD